MDSASVFLLILSVMAAYVSAAKKHEDVLDTSSDITEQIEKANAHSKTALVHGDIIPSPAKNAVPCTARGCKWRKYGRYVYVPVSFSRSYSRNEMNTIIRGLLTFHSTTCIRFVWRRWWHSSYIYFFSGSGCWSYLGRQSRGQRISLKKNGCLHNGIIQHEVLHALGFHHEQVRSDRDEHVRILFENILQGREGNFKKVETNNLGTPYDLTSVMQYYKYAFSKNGKPTILAKSDPDLNFGYSDAMTQNDIDRVNRLYQCCE
ncbi:high choriolytic enzyme 1-like [Salarias fasciatus]|uniref:high choriolytic enzyme 1-like n=1 Tax=Salarias fasciatus TaxID=181472 RepID=UPI0011770476|nr:high choriolytic enzyme 1-like [Salarias fasciatus]